MLEERLSQLEKLVQVQSELLIEAKQQTAILAGATQSQTDHMQKLTSFIEGALGRNALPGNTGPEPLPLALPDEDPTWRHCSICNLEWQAPPDRCNKCRIKGGRGRFIRQVDYTPATWNDHGNYHNGPGIASFTGGADAAAVHGGAGAPPFGQASVNSDRILGTSPCARAGRHTDGHSTYTMEQMTGGENGESWVNSMGGKNCQQSWNISIHIKNHQADTWHFYSVRTKANLQYTMACRCCGQYATCYAGYADIKDLDRIDRTFEEFLGVPHIPGHQEQVDMRRQPVLTAPPAPWTGPIATAPPEPWVAPLPPPSEPSIPTRKAPPPAPPATLGSGASYSGWGDHGLSSNLRSSGIGHTPPHAGPGTSFMPVPTPLPASAINEYSSECHV